jgi:flagellar hook protein FlgE
MTVNWSPFSGTTGKLTQFKQDSGVSATSQDGVTAGQITKVGMSNGGIIVAEYSNGKQAVVGQLALASIQNPGSMTAVGNNNLKASAETSAPAVGAAGTSGHGDIVANALEGSTVDIATEFTQLITLQRSYQAASKVITTSDQVMQDLISLIR